MGAATLTRKQLRRLIAGPLGLNGLLSGTAQDDGTTTVQDVDKLVDASSDGFKDSAYATDRFDGAWLYLPATDEEHRVLAYDPGAGTITLGRSMSVTPTSGATEYELHTHGIPPSGLHEAIKWAARSALHEDWVLLPGLLTDGDIADSTLAHWTVAAAATKSRVLQDDDSYALRVQTTGAADYVVSDAIRVSESIAYRVGARVRAATTATTAAITVYDRTNGAAVTVSWGVVSSVSGADGSAWVHLQGSFTVPAGCASIEIRLGGGSGAGDASWQDLYVYDATAEQLALPDWMQDPLDSIVAVNYRYRTNYYDRASYLQPIVTAPPVGRFLQVRPCDYPGPIVLHVARGWSEPAAETDTLPAWAQDWLAAGARKAAYEALTRPTVLDTSRLKEAYQQANARWTAGQIAHNPILRHGRATWG